MNIRTRLPALKGASVNYSSNSSCDERTYQPYMERQETTLVIVCVINTHPEAFVSYHPIFKCKLL